LRASTIQWDELAVILHERPSMALQTHGRAFSKTCEMAFMYAEQFGDRRSEVKVTVLVADDEKGIADTLVQILNAFGFNAVAVYSGLDAIARARVIPFDALITDVVMSEISGIDASIEICAILPRCKVLLLSGNIRTDDLMKEAISKGHDFDILAKPVHPSLIINWLQTNVVVN
jgi:CheY-like chemotaxis protein